MKRLKIDALCPDRIVAIVCGTGLDTLLAPMPADRICCLAPSPGARAKSAPFRATARQPLSPETVAEVLGGT
ncbi:MAG TPA: hypothetical protein VE690_05740 [Rhodopila sp.]|nr:hypothetical protein [Rhodopila sp.]